MEKRKYYLGLDIGTDSVGYAATGTDYSLLKFKGEPVWGTTTFEAASLAQERRTNRTARRRIDRRQQRVQLLSELFAPEICRIDPHFFIRRLESALFAEDSQYGVSVLDDPAPEKEYHKKYPTIHHLIYELMTDGQPHDVRLVYLACAWLVAHRGHFLYDADDAHIGDFSAPYRKLESYLADIGADMPWPEATRWETVQSVMQTRTGTKRKQELFVQQVYGGKKPPKVGSEGFPFSRSAIVSLLCGGKVKPAELFQDEAYAGVGSAALSMDEESFVQILADLGEGGDLLSILREMYDCALLNTSLDGCSCISEAKVKVYRQHQEDLLFLKRFIRNNAKEKYNLIFRSEKGYYSAYVYNTKSCADPDKVKKINKETFCDNLKKLVKDIPVTPKDEAAYRDMMDRLEQRTFLPKQKDPDNRVIPQQLYRVELAAILERAKGYLPMLSGTDESGLTAAEKILSVFDFRIPYYVGPLNRANSKNAWVVRKEGKILPWNFEQMVDLDASEQAFIDRMTNRCTYLPGEEVLPANSLLYSRYMVLNELNNLKINDRSIPISVKQELYTNLLLRSRRRVSRKTIADYLRSHGYMEPDDQISGVDIQLNADLKPWQSFARLMETGALNEAQVEDIIRHAAYTEDKNRMDRFLRRTFPQLEKADRKYILSLNLKGFGRLSARLLTGILHVDPGTGEAVSVMDALWNTNENLMQLLSDRYTFREQIEAYTAEYYNAHPRNLSDRLDEMYISNAVKRPVFRTLDITGEVVKAMGCPPAKIFVEMARGASEDQVGKRTKTRKAQILELYQAVKTEDAHRLLEELEAMGEAADNRLQSDRLFLYYLQLGRCMYTGEPIDLSALTGDTYDTDHIYPRSKVRDDSLLNNKVLVRSSVNGAKTDRYPIDGDIRRRMRPFWDLLLSKKLITEEKHRRLTRSTPFTEEELRGFINRQLVETRQSTKAVAQLLKERYPQTEIVYVKAGLVSEFRQEFGMLKCRAVNDLHHAKDAYLNIAVGNVYHEKFTRHWFRVDQEYTLNTRPLFTHPQYAGGSCVWKGGEDLSLVRRTMAKNAVHLTRYSFCRKGGLFDQQPVKAGEDLVPRKAGLNTEKYGGYNKPTASFYLLASYRIGKKRDVMFVPIELLVSEKIRADSEYAVNYTAGMISRINGGKPVDQVLLLLGGRPIKINTVLELDGMRVVLRGKANKGAVIIVSPLVPLIVGAEFEQYIKHLERFTQKKQINAAITISEAYDRISAEKNMALYALLRSKLTDSVFSKCPGSIRENILKGAEAFAGLSVEEQVAVLLSMVSWFGSAPNCDLSKIGGGASCGAKTLNAKLSAWAKSYSDVRLIDISASGLFESRSENLLELL